MYHGGRPDPPHPVAAAVGAIAGGAAGAITGYVAFLLATFFPHMLRTALPAMGALWFIVLWIAALAVPLGWFARIRREGKGAGTAAFAVCGMAAVCVLFAVDATGLKRVFPRETTWYVTPAYPPPAAPDVRR